MNILVFSFNGVFPICLTMLIGYFLCRWKIMEKGTAEKLNQLAYKVLIPCSLFMNMYRADLSAVMDVPLLLLSLLGTSAVILALCLLSPHVTQTGAQRGEFIQGIFRGNTAILGLPLITNLYGETATAVLALPLSVMIIFYNIAAPVILSFYAGTGKTDLKSIGRKVITNPFLIGTLLGDWCDRIDPCPAGPGGRDRSLGVQKKRKDRAAGRLPASGHSACSDSGDRDCDGHAERTSGCAGLLLLYTHCSRQLCACEKCDRGRKPGKADPDSFHRPLHADHVPDHYGAQGTGCHVNPSRKEG